EAEHSITTAGAAAIVFQPLPTGDFQQIVADVEETVRSTGQETGTSVDTHDDEFGYRWVILRDTDLEDLAVGVNAVSDALAVGGRGGGSPALARPVLRAIGARMGPDREIVVLPGNHDAALVRPWLRAHRVPGAVNARVPLDATPLLADVSAWLAPAQVRVHYP